MPIVNNKLTADPNGIYHAATVCCPDSSAVRSFEYMAGDKSLIWTMVPNIWWVEKPPKGELPQPRILFPIEQVTDLRANAPDCIPFIRMAPQSKIDWKEKDGEETLYSMSRIANGDFDKSLLAWGAAAQKFGQPLLVEFGAEMNGKWHPWNATYNGKDTLTAETAPDGKPRYLGQKRYRDAHIHIINLFNSIHVDNVTWMFHANSDNNPHAEWNRMAGYYPGDEYIDWIGVSCYGAYRQGPLTPLQEILDPVIEEIRTFSAGVVTGTKPIAIAELGAFDHCLSSKPDWIRDAYHLLATQDGAHGPYRKQIKAVSWWDESWWEGKSDDGPAYLNNVSIASSPASVAAYREAVKPPLFLEFI